MKQPVYIVDDNDAMRDALRRLLDTAGFEVEAFANGPSFLEACRKNRPSCAVLDMAMPGMSGDEVQAALNEAGLRIPIVFLTGHGDVPMAVRALKSGAVDFLEKPVPGAVLMERVRRALALDAQRRGAEIFAQDIQECYARLTSREREIMGMVVSGLSSKEIARQLGLSPRTVETHRTHINNKMGAANVVELVEMAAHCKL